MRFEELTSDRDEKGTNRGEAVLRQSAFIVAIEWLTCDKSKREVIWERRETSERKFEII